MNNILAGRWTRRMLLGAIVGVLCQQSNPSVAEAPYPNQPIKVVVGYPAGGSGDITGRIVADILNRHLGVSAIVENVGGAGGSVAAQRVISSPPDGYTLMVAANNEVLINNLVNHDIKYDGLRDLTHIGLVNHQPVVLVASPKAEAKSIDDFVNSAKSNPGKLTYGSSGVGTSFHIIGELVKQKAGLSMVHVPYRGAAPLITDLLGGQIDYGVVVLSSALPSIRSGALAAVGTTEAKRAKSASDIPALAEHPLFKDLDMGNWFILCGPKGIPDEIVQRLKGALQAGLAEAEVVKRLDTSGSEPFTGKEDVLPFLTSEQAKYRRIVESAKIKIGE